MACIKLCIALTFFIICISFTECKRKASKHNKIKNYRVLETVPEVATGSEVLASLIEKTGLDADQINSKSNQFLLDLYEGLKKDGDRKLHDGDTVRSFSAKATVYEGKGKAKLTFNLSAISENEIALHAELHVKSRGKVGETHKFRVTVSGVDNDKEKYSAKASVAYKTFDGYLVFNITEIIQFIIKKNDHMFEKVANIVIRHIAKRGGDKKTKRSTQSENLYEDVFIMVYSQDKQFFNNFNSILSTEVGNLELNNNNQLHTQNQRSRTKRNTSTDKKKKCTLKELIVDFKELGWDKWIIFPRKYNANVCNGRCPSPVNWSLNPTNHAMIQSILRLGNKKIPKTCCTATKYSSLSMMYFEQGEIVIRQHKDMIAEECGCR